MTEDFLLTTPLARTLYHTYAKSLPLADYHSHLCVADLATDRTFENINELWIKSDPYKHRAMRMCGVPEEKITGGVSDEEKFRAWCGIYPSLVGNPLYHWSQIELDRVFGIDLPICTENADKICERANNALCDGAHTARGVFSSFNVAYTAPCTQFLSDLSVFNILKTQNVVPSLRGDDILPFTKAFADKLSENTGILVTDTETLRAALSARLDNFHSIGCRFSDHALDSGFDYTSDDGNNGERLHRLLDGETLGKADGVLLDSFILRLLASEYARRGWVMQLHIGALRATSTRLRNLAGKAGGFAGIGSFEPEKLTVMLDDMEKTCGLPRTVLYTLNPAYNAVLSVLCGSYSEDGIAAKVQMGPAWWWCDHFYGMKEVFESLAAFGVISRFIGMTTDSRSLMSFARHDYFRRVLCAFIGEKAEKGEFPSDEATLATIVKSMCYENIKNYLINSGIEL